LAFLLPAIQKALVANESPEVKNRKLNTPLVVIATPGRELAAQIKDVAETLCSQLDLTVYIHPFLVNAHQYISIVEIL
jgi:superfamily II DNA/RNA helicase